MACALSICHPKLTLIPRLVNAQAPKKYANFAIKSLNFYCPVPTDGKLSNISGQGLLLIPQAEQLYFYCLRKINIFLPIKKQHKVYSVLGSFGFQWSGFHLCAFPKNNTKIQPMRFSLHNQKTIEKNYPIHANNCKKYSKSR